MPHPGRFQLVVEELRRSLSPQGDTVTLDRVSVDPVTAAIWHLLAHDADVAADATPAVAMQSAIDKLEAEIGKEPTTQAGTLVREAAKSMVDGLRELDPDKLYDAYRKTSAAYEITRGKKAERLQLQDVASGWFATEPDLELRGRPELRTSHVVRRDGLAFIVALSDAMRMLESSATAADGPRMTMARVMEQIVRATILKEPFLIDAEAVAHMAKSSAPADVNRLNALRGVYLMLQRLAKRGLSTTPRFVSLLQRESGHWSELPGGTLLFSDADLLDKLSAPLSPPLPLKNVDPVIDQEAPLQGMTGGKRLLRQTLDRAQGRIDIEFDLDLDSIFSDDGRAFKSTVYFDALPTGATSDMRLKQDRQIRQLDDFIRAHFLRVIDKPENSLPPEIRMKGDEIFVGKLRVATRLDDRWTGDAEAIKRAVATLWVHDWTPASFPQTRGRLGVARPSFGKGAKRLTLVLQMENDGVITRNGDIMVKQHPDETASVQLNREGGFRIVAGEDLIRGLGSGGLVKIVVIGHGIRRGNLDEPALSGYSPAALSSRVDTALRELRLPRRVDRVTLFSCTLESPVYPRSFASEFLLAADKAGFLRPQASVTAYAENVALSPFGSRRTQPHGDARMEVHRPETTFSFHIDAKTKTVVRTDKYPGTSEDGITGPVQRIDADIRLVGAFVAQDDPSWRPGAAGKLFEMFSTLHDTAKKMSIGKSGGGDIDFPQEMPDAISDAVQRQLSALEGVEPQKVVDPGGLTRAAKLISDGVWQRNPDLIYNAYQELSKAFGEESVRWQLDDLPMGVVDQVRMPSQLLSQYPGSLMLPIEEFALMKGLEAGVTAVDGLPPGQGSDASRVHFNRQTLELLKVTLSERPFTVDKDLVDTLLASSDPADRARLRTLEVVHGAAMKLVRQGVVQSPIYLTDFPQGDEAGWTRHEDGSSIHQGDLLPGLLPGRRSEVMRARTGTSIEFDDAKPLTRLFAFMPAAKQTLDREAGTITIKWPNTTSGKQAASVLRFRPADATPGSHSQKLQEAEIRMIDEFLVGAFFDSSLLSFNALPGDLRLEGDALIAARAILARRRDGQWVPDSEALRRHWVVVGTGVARGTPEKPVSSWDSSLDGLGDGAGHSHRVRKERLLVVLQMEDDLVLSRYVRRALVRNESDVVWIQVDGLGQHVIRAGAQFLPTTDKDRPVKIEILGHGGHDLTTRSQTLSGYLSTQLVDRVAPVLDELKLKSRAGHVTLVSCALETPSIEHSFGKQFLQYATDQGVIALDAEVVAYRDVLGVDMRPGHEWTSRFTEPYPGAGRETHAPGSTWLFKKNPGTGEIERSDKYPKPPVDDSSTTDLADKDLDETLTDYDLSDRGLDPSTTFIPGRRGRAGTLMTALETLERVLRRAKLGPLKGDPPEALLQAIKDELLKVRPEQSDVDAARAPVAAKAIAEGLWTMSPKKLYEGFVALSQMYGSGAGAKVAFHFGDLPAGLVANVRFPSKVLEAFHKSMAIPAAEAGLLRAMRVEVPTQVWLTDEMDPDLMRMMLVRHTANLVESILSGRPFVVDVDQLNRLSPPGLKRKLESPKLDVLTAVHGTAVQLARRGAVASPIYMTDAKTDLGDGWERFGDGSSIHRGDLLPTLLPHRKGDITRARALLKTAVDGDKPLKDLSEIVPDARQVLDRDKGTITITWPGAEGTRQASTVLKFRSLNGDTSQALRDLQDADIVALDRFIVPAFIHQPASRKNSMPAELRLADGTLTASRATLAKLDDKRWTPQMETILQAQYLLGGDSDVKPATPVEQWEHDFDSERAPAGLDQGKTGKLRIVIQLEDDPKILRGAHRAIRRHPLETVWIQVDRLGKHKIRHGSHLLENLDPATPIKLTLKGHGRIDGVSRTAHIGYSKPAELAGRVAPVLEALKLTSRIEQAVLTGCAMVAPFLVDDYAETFLELAIEKGILRHDASLEAYAENVVLTNVAVHKGTRRFEGEKKQAHAVGATWIYKKSSETKKILRTDKFPASESSAYGIDKLEVIYREDSRNPQPGRAGKLFESLDTLAATQARGGISKTRGDAPDTAVQAVRERLQSLFSKLAGVSEDGLSKAAKSIADGLWQRDPSKVYEGYDQLSRLCTAESGHVVNLTWGDLPTGVVDRTRLPSQLLWKFDKDVSMPLPDAALVHGMQAAVTIMDGPPLDARPDAAGRAFARQTLALVEATLSGRPFIIDADAVFRMSTSKEADARATLEVLDVAYATSMQLSRRNVIEAPIYLTDAQSRLDVGWERYPDGSLVHRGDILPSILPERGDQLNQLQTPVPVAVDETNPLSKLTRFMPGATQTLDRKAGTIRIAWPDLTDGRQADSVLKFSPSDAGPGTEDRRRQDADILALDDFIIGEFFESAGPVRNGLPGELTFDGIRVIAGRAVLAERKDGRWLRDDAALRQARSILGPWTSTAGEERPAMKWFGGAVTDARTPGKAARLLIHLQMDEDIVMQQGAQGTVKHHPDETVWIQVDRQGTHVIRHGAELLAKADATLPVKIEVSGHGTHDHETRTQRLAGYGAEELATRLKSVITDLKLTSRAKNLTLVSCAIETPVVSGSFGTAFTKAAIDEGVVHQDATVVAYGEVLVKPSGLVNGRRSRSTRRHPDVAPVAHAPGVTWMFRKHAETGEILKIDKYPDAESGIDGADEDSPQRQLELHREEAYEAVRRNATDDLAGRSLRLHGIDVPADFLASLGARFDDEPLTGDLLRAMADQPGDPLLRLKIDPELLERWVALLPEQADVELGDRLHALGRWMDAREKADGAGAAFIEPASTKERATADRLIVAVKPDDDGNLSSDADLLKAARGDETASTSLLGEILQDLSPQTRTDFEDWMKRTGQSFEDVKAMEPSKVSREGDTPVEKVAREIERRARGDDGIDLDKIVGVNKDNAIAALREIGVVKADKHGLRLDAARLQSYIDSGDGVKLAYAGRALSKMSGKAYRALLDAAPDGVRPFMTETRAVPSAGKTSFAGVADKFDGAIDVVDTVLGMYQILSNWDRMSQTQKGLSVTQSLSIVISPLAMMAGRAMSTLGLVARSALLRGVSAGLAGGGANVALSALGVASCVLQWEEFNASGQSLDSYAGKSLIANTVMTATSAILAVASAGVGIAVFVAGGAAAVAGTALGMVSAMLGPIGIAAAAVMFICNAVVQAALWFEEFGQYIRESTSVSDKAAAAFAKAFGFSTDVTLRAEMEKAAREAAARLSKSLKTQLQDSMEFEAKMLAKQQGYDTAMIPDTTHVVKHATFYDAASSQKYNFALQPHAPTATEFRKVVQDKPLGSGSTDTAWLSMDLIKSDLLGRAMYGHRPKDDDRQLFQLGNLVDASVFGGHGADVFQMKKVKGVTIHGWRGRSLEGRDEDEVQIDAEGSDVSVQREPFGEPHATAVRFPDFGNNRIIQVPRVVIRNAGKVSVQGSIRDDFYDISAKEAWIYGLEGRNTYVARNGNNIVVSSSDVAVWTRGVDGVHIHMVDMPGTKSSLLLKVDVLHESLSFRRNGKDLDILIGKESLTLKSYFRRLEASSPDSAPLLTFVDVVGTIVTLSKPGAITEQTLSITELDKDLAFSTELPASRRTLSGDEAENTYRLSSGTGEVRVLPMTWTPMNVLLDVPVERLGLLLEGDDLLIVETKASDAPAGFTPLRLRLPGQRRSSSKERFSGVTVWAKDKDQKPAALALPEPGKSDLGPVRVRESGKETADTTGASATKNGSSTPGQGTDKADKIDARDLPGGSVLRGGDGADTYLIKAGQTLVIDNSARDSALDVMEVHDIDRQALLDSLRFSRSGGDLVIEMAGGKVTVQDHAARPHARHLSLKVGAERFALPVVVDGLMVHLPFAAEGDVLATTPGAHLVLSTHDKAWHLSEAKRKVWMRRPVRQQDHGSSVEAIVEGDRPSSVMLMGYRRAPEDWHLVENLAQDDGGRAGIVELAHYGGTAETAALYKDLLDSSAVSSAEYTPRVVQAYLEARGMPRELARSLRGTPFSSLRRLHRLLAVVVDGDDWRLKASFIKDYLPSGLTPSSHQGPVLRLLASRAAPWAYHEAILRGDLSLKQLDVFESWASTYFKGRKAFSGYRPALGSFLKLLKGEKPSTHFVPSLVEKVLELKGHPAAAAEELSLVMVAAGTMDEKWAAGMLQAGVVHHDVLKRLWKAGVSPQDVMLGNANRQRYEGSGDRSALISVDTSPTFKSNETWAFRYTMNYYLKLDSEGREFARMDKVPEPGVVYDYVPGVIVDENGQSPDPVAALEEWNEEYTIEADRLERRRKEVKDGSWSCGPICRLAGEFIADHMKGDIPALSSVVRLERRGFATSEKYKVEPAWDGRSTPGNLVDGVEGHDEVVAWRPGGPTPSSADDKSKPDITINPGKYIQFDFAHPIALTELIMHVAASSEEDAFGKPFRGGHNSRWEVSAERLDGTWVDLPYSNRLLYEYYSQPKARWGVVSGGVPYKRYRLRGVEGKFPKASWFSEVEFVTEEAGTDANTRMFAKRLQDAGYGSEEIRSLFLHGLNSEWTVRCAIALRQHVGVLPASVVMNDIRSHSGLSQHEIALIGELKANAGAQPWAPEALLQAVRIRGAGLHRERLNTLLPFLDPESIVDEEHRQFVSQFKEALNAKGDESENGTDKHHDTAQEHLPLSWVPSWLTHVVSLSALDGKVQDDRDPYASARRLVDERHAQLAARDGETEARRATAPWYLHLAALTATASNRVLRLGVGPETSTDDPAALQSLIERSLPGLQDAQNEGLLKVGIVSSMPPVGEKAPWLVSTSDPATLHLSPGVDLPAEYREGRAGQPVARLVAGGFTEEDATAMAAHGVSTLERITRAIEMRRLFGGLSWEVIVDDVILDQPFDEGQLRLAGYLATLPWWQDRPEASSAAVRRGLTADERTKLLDGLLPAGGHALIQSRRLGHLVRKVMDWLRQAQDPDGKETPSPANTKVAVELVQAAAGLPGALRRALELAGVAKWKRSPATTTTEPPSWAPQMLQGFISLVPVEGEVSEVSLDAPIEIVLSTYEKLLERIGEDLRAQGHGAKNVEEALRPKYVDLAVLRAAIGGRELLLHVPPGESSEEQSVTTLIEARLADLQKARDLDLLRVRIASALPARGDDEPWATTLLGGTTWHLSSEATLDAAWKRGKDSQVIPRLKEAGFDAADAQTLYGQGVRTLALVTRAIELRRLLPDLPADVIAGDVHLPVLPEEDLEYAGGLARHPEGDDVKILAALRDNTLVSLREVWFDVGHYFAPDSDDLIHRAYVSGMGTSGGGDGDLDLLVSSLKKSLGESLAHLLPEHDKAVGDVAVRLMRSLAVGSFSMSEPFPLSSAILTLQLLQIRTGRPLLPAPESTPWMPERLRGLVSFVDVDAGGRGIALPTLVVLQAFEDLLEKVEARLDERGLKTASASRALDHHFLRLAIMRAAAGGQRLLLHVPQTASPKDRLRKDLIHAALRGLERARVDGLVDVAIASSQPPVDQKLAWSTQTLQGSTLHVASAQPLEAAWEEALGGYPVHRMAKAGYSDDDAQALLVGGINTLELADRASQLRELFGTLSTDVVLKDVLEKPALGPQELELAKELAEDRAWLPKDHQLDALGLVRGGGDDLARVYRVCRAVPREDIGFRISEENQQKVRTWLMETQGPGATLDDAVVTALSAAIITAVRGSVDALRSAILIARGQRLLHDGQATADDPVDWIPRFMRRDVKVVPVDKAAGKPTMAASDYVVLRTFKRLLDHLHADLEKESGQAHADRMTLERHLQLQVLRAAATGQTLELRMPAKDSGSHSDEVAYELAWLPGEIEQLRIASGKLEKAGLKISFLPATSGDTNGDMPTTNSQEVESDGQGDRPVKRAKRAAEEPTSDLSRGEDSRRQAALLMQDIAGRTDVDPGVTSFSAVRTMPSPMTFLTGQTA